jgi:diguanylate cyclase (GGDEF)-like protein
LIDAAGQVAGILTSSIDITERKEAENHLRHMAHHDALTDLANRTLLGIRISREIARARRGGRPFALHLIDIDKFSDINELFGYDTGDLYLIEVARRLKSLARRFDTVARTGGNEFAILQTQVEGSEDALHFAGRLMDAIAKPFAADAEGIVASACVGVTVALQDGDNASLLFKNADTALRRAKGEGLGRRSLFASDMRARSVADARLDTELRLALEDKQFRLFFQPQVKAATGEIVGAEALVRWDRPGVGLQGPGVFLPRAELTGFVVKINEWVLMEACRAAHGWRKLGLPRMRIGVNMSAIQFSRQNVPLLVARALGESGLDPSLLDLELTESSVLEDSEGLIHDLTQIQQLGCEISIDDFGTGYSSLRYVKRFPVNRLKIDQSFVRNLPSDPNDVAIVRTILTLGHSLDLEVIAEGVETEEQRAFLVGEGCDEAQGFLFARPMPHDEFVTFVAGVRPVALTA